jgi:hypothetical protein
MGVKIKRVYDPPSSSDGYRVLVDRLWPRGLSKASLTVRAASNGGTPVRDGKGAPLIPWDRSAILLRFQFPRQMFHQIGALIIR